MDYSQKKDIIKNYQTHSTDTGSMSVQVAIFTKKIQDIQSHLAKEEYKKDVSSRRGLLKLINKRRKALFYLMNEDADRFVRVVEELGLTKEANKLKNKQVGSAKTRTLSNEKKASIVYFEE
jgi:small subunit ribosomal protein S15